MEPMKISPFGHLHGFLSSFPPPDLARFVRTHYPELIAGVRLEGTSEQIADSFLIKLGTDRGKDTEVELLDRLLMTVPERSRELGEIAGRCLDADVAGAFRERAEKVAGPAAAAMAALGRQASRERRRLAWGSGIAAAVVAATVTAMAGTWWLAETVCEAEKNELADVAAEAVHRRDEIATLYQICLEGSREQGVDPDVACAGWKEALDQANARVAELKARGGAAPEAVPRDSGGAAWVQILASPVRHGVLQIRVQEAAAERADAIARAQTASAEMAVAAAPPGPPSGSMPRATPPSRTPAREMPRPAVDDGTPGAQAAATPTGEAAPAARTAAEAEAVRQATWPEIKGVMLGHFRGKCPGLLSKPVDIELSLESEEANSWQVGTHIRTEAGLLTEDLQKCIDKALDRVRDAFDREQILRLLASERSSHLKLPEAVASG